ncbi:MAG: hypothetical protein K2F65_05690, partial [Eubacterium sp.]|nr:hypothetical protein [Eubacterium sp.]
IVDTDLPYYNDLEPFDCIDLGNIKNFEYKEYFNHLLNYLENKSKGGEDYSDVISAIKEKL